MATLKDLKHAYMIAKCQADEDGISTEFYNEATPLVMEDDTLLPEIIRKALQQTWTTPVGRDAGPTLDMFVDGNQMPTEVVIPRVDEFGKKYNARRLFSSCSIADWDKHVLAQWKHIGESTKAAVLDQEIGEVFDLRSGGNKLAKLCDLVDEATEEAQAED